MHFSTCASLGLNETDDTNLVWILVVLAGVTITVISVTCVLVQFTRGIVT